MPQRIILAARPRSIVGKHVKQLRREGRLPANVYGKGLDSTAIDLDAREFTRSIKITGVRHLFDLTIDGESASRPVVVRGLTRFGGTGDPLHVDFYQVDVTKPIQANVALRLIGVAPAVHDLAGTLVQNVEHVSVRCYPLEIPDVIEADATKLTGFDVSLTIGDIVPPANVTLLSDPSVVVASVLPPRIRTDDAVAGGE